jgi:hypothetical protein
MSGRVAIVGAGPSGFYSADQLLSAGFGVELGRDVERRELLERFCAVVYRGRTLPDLPFDDERGLIRKMLLIAEAQGESGWSPSGTTPA